MSRALVEHPAQQKVPGLASFWSLSEEEVRRLLAADGGGGSARTARSASPRWSRAAGLLRVLVRQFTSPITLILIVAALIATATGDVLDGSIIVAIVVASALLGAWQEGRAADAVSALLKTVAVEVAVRRDGAVLQVRPADVHAGDELSLAAGDLIPADCLLLHSHDLTVDESALTGESFPADKRSGPALDAGAALDARTNALFAGTHVISGTGTALAVLTGAASTFGHITTTLAQKAGPTSFETGVHRFGLLLLRVMLALVGVILLINLILHRSLIDSLLFALALAVGMTPQMLPVVVTVSLAAGARRMARSKAIVKRLDVIEDLGAMSVLCTDKTGTVTVGVVGVGMALDSAGSESSMVLDLAVLNAGLQTAYPNPLDAAIVGRQQPPQGALLLDEVPYDFHRKRLSVVTTVAGAATLITKGALESVLACCTSAGGAPLDLPARAAIRSRAEALGGQGFRVLGVATRMLGEGEHPVDVTSERDLVFEGMVAFRDPIKAGAGASIADLSALGVRVKVISGDNRYVTGALAAELGLTGRVVLGAELERADDAELDLLVSANDLFAEVEPEHKVIVVRALKRRGETVGFLGDGINDAGALHAADVGLSVQTAVNVAKEAAAIVLLEQDLGVVAAGVRLGRRTFANTMKYVRVAASSNFGNILSMVVAAALLPFLPMLPAQILLLNFLADIPNTAVSRDRVDPERLRVAGSWDMRALTRFMIVFGAVSTAFDLATFAILEWGFRAGPELFHTGWFVESALTQFVAMMALRTSRAAWRSRPDRAFLAVSAVVAAFTAVLPFTPWASLLGFAPLPLGVLALLVGVALTYGAALEWIKRFVRF